MRLGAEKTFHHDIRQIIGAAHWSRSSHYEFSCVMVLNFSLQSHGGIAPLRVPHQEQLITEADIVIAGKAASCAKSIHQAGSQ